MDFVGRVLAALLELHPWHIMLVHFPTALTAVGLLCALLALWRRSGAFEQFAHFSTVIAAVGTAAAGLAGLRDHFVLYDGAAPYVNIKIFLGVSLLVLTSVTALWRWRRPEALWGPSTRILYLGSFLASFLLATVLGFVGGSIVYGF